MKSHPIPELETQEEEPQAPVSPRISEAARYSFLSDDYYEDDCEDHDLRPVPDATIRGFLRSVFKQ